MKITDFFPSSKPFSNTGECVSTNDNVRLPLSYIIESDDEIMPSQNKSFLPIACMPSTSHQDKVISQSHEEPQAAREPTDPPKTKAAEKPMPPSTATASQLLLETRMDQLAAQQKDMLEALKSIQKSVTDSLSTQNKMHNLVKGSFLELQKTLLSGQKTSRHHSGILELSLNSLHAKLDEMNSALRVKQLQEMMSSDESEPSASGTQEIGFAPTAAYASAAMYTPTNTPARKRPSDQSPSPRDSMKIMKKSK